MVAYVVLANFTDQGVRNARESPKRADAFKDLAKTFGVTVQGDRLDTGTLRHRHHRRCAG